MNENTTYQEMNAAVTPTPLDELSEEAQIDEVAREILETYHPAFEELAK